MRGGQRVIALDLFGDRDLRAVAETWATVRRRTGGILRFDADDLLDVASRVAPPAAGGGLVYGAGFEDDARLLRVLSSGRELLGNPADVVERVKDPHALEALASAAGIPHPVVRNDPPRDPSGWLSKLAGGSGGGHVVPASRAPDAVEGGLRRYFQRIAAGRAISALFLADGRDALLVGLSEQWTRAPGIDFGFAGATGPVELAPALEGAIRAIVDRFVGASGVRGCCSLDLLVDGERVVLLECNPRPPATLDLYDDDWARGLFDAHVAACRGVLPSVAPGPREARAFAVVYAPRTMRQPRRFAWPDDCRDVPCAPAGRAEFEAGAPICTVHAASASAALARRAVAQRAEDLLQRLQDAAARDAA